MTESTTFEAALTVSDKLQSSPTEIVTRDRFREAMSRVGSAVHIVTTDGVAGRAGLTATAFSAVSDAPPIVLVCVNRASRSHDIISKNQVFCVNTLAAEAELMADLFAGRNVSDPEADRFAGVDISRAITGAPVLSGALSSIDCKLEKSVEMGTHTVFFGAVQEISLGSETEGLIYRDRAYHSL